LALELAHPLAILVDLEIAGLEAPDWLVPRSTVKNTQTLLGSSPRS
jgi:hypothetical protein